MAKSKSTSKSPTPAAKQAEEELSIALEQAAGLLDLLTAAAEVTTSRRLMQCIHIALAEVKRADAAFLRFCEELNTAAKGGAA